MAKEHLMERPLPMTAITENVPSTPVSTNSRMADPRQNKPLPPTPPRGRKAIPQAPHPISSSTTARRSEGDGPPDWSSCPLSPSGMGQSRRPPRPRLMFESPRLELADDQIFPPAKDLATPEKRWKYMSDLAGAHKQDGSVLRLRAPISPRTLPLGMPVHAADRVKELHLPPQTETKAQERKNKERNARDDYDDYSDEEDEHDTRLPQWLDAVVQTFHNLQHLYLHSSANADESENSKQLRRLYVLYRLPYLVSIDGVEVTDSERRLARPTSPNRQRTPNKDWFKRRLAEEEQNQTRPQREGVSGQQKPKRDTQAWLSDVLDEKKEDDRGDPHAHKPVNVEVDLTGKMTESALTPPYKMTDPETIYETTSSVATADCAWAATCGHFFRPDSMRKQWSKSRLRFSSSTGKDSKVSKADGDLNVLIPVTRRESVTTETDHLTVVDAASLSPIISKTLRPKGMQPPRLVLDASKGSPDRTSSLVIKSVPPTAPSMPSSKETPASAKQASDSPNARCPPSRSLSSPFPIQFRDLTSSKRTRNKSPPKRIMPSPQQGSGSPQRASPPMRARRISPRRDLRLNPESPAAVQGVDAQLASKSFTITGLSKPVEMKRTKSTPSGKAKRDLPPPCPGGGRRLLRTITPRISKSKFKKQNARNTSIIDREVDSDEDKEEKETTLVVLGTADCA